jgi:fimbrial chaperone protein
MAEDGTETNKDVPESAFLVFPARFVLEKGAQQALKVQWRGGSVGNRERAFRIIAEQVPVVFEKAQGSGITLLFKYVGALYVVPPKASPADISVTFVEGAAEKGIEGFLVRLENRGGTHVILVDTALQISENGLKKFNLATSALAAIEGQNILAGRTRGFFIPFAEAQKGQRYEGLVTYNAER